MKNEMKDHLDYAADALRTQIGIIQDEIEGAEEDYTDTVSLAEEIELEIGRLKDQQEIIRRSIGGIQPEDVFDLKRPQTMAEKIALFGCCATDCCDESCADLCCRQGRANKKNNRNKKVDLNQLIG